MTKTGTARYSVTNSVGTRDGKTFAIWDRFEVKTVAWFKTLSQAMKAVRRFNEDAR